MDSLLLAVAVGVIVWLMIRRGRLKRMQQMKARQEAGGEVAEPKAMPRLGRPGTITREQTARLKKMDFNPDRGWSDEEAQLIIDSVMYLRAAIEDATGETDAPPEVQNRVLAFILTDDDLRDYLLSWGDNRARRGESEEPPTLRKNEHYERVTGFIGSLRDDD